MEEKQNKSEHMNQIKAKSHSAEMQIQSSRPFNICETLYANDSDAKLLTKMEDCRHPDLNTIHHSQMAELLQTNSHPFIVIDCRFDYEYQGGHIKGAMNVNKPEQIEDLFFKNKTNIETLMKQNTIMIFHCEFSQ